MSLTNPKDVVTEERLSEFYQGIFPYLGGMPEMVANKFSKGDLYATSEKMIGCWVDNRPLYQKTVTTGGSVPSGATLIQRTTQTGYDTILYTKTTDSPIAIGSDTDYSTDEKIVGTWIDGKPIYQKTIQTTMTSTSGVVKYVSTGTTIAKVIDYKAMIYTGGAWGQKLESIGANNELNSFGRCIVTSSADPSNPNKIGLTTNISGWLNQEVIVTIQYTKTS